MVGKIFAEFGVILAMTVGAIYVFGLLIALCNRVFYSNFGRHSLGVCYATGIIGTPLHELSHALMCLLFFHQVVEIVLFEPGRDDGILGYVRHQYNRKNIYQTIGNFFIGVAPIVVMSALIYLLLWAFMPDLAHTVANEAGNIVLDNGAEGFFGPIGDMLGEVGQYLTSWQLWVFLLICLFICPHMTLSGLDVTGSFVGLVFMIIVIFLVTMVFGIFGEDSLNTLHVAMMKVASIFNMIMLLALIVSLIEVFFSFIIRFIFKTR